jgi:group I intron endonuclease
MGFIYKITSPSNKVYIGQTIKTVEKRWKEHIEDALNIKKNHCKALNEAIKKYDSSVFKLEILIECDNNLLNSYENYFILQYKSYTPYGYNIKLGGSNGSHSQETKDKISLSLKGRIISDETKYKMMISKKSNNLPMYLIKIHKDGIHTGYRICNHPKGKEKRFQCKTDSMECKLYKAIDYLNYLNKL